MAIVNKPKILFILHLPPPVHGAAMMGKYLRDAKLINEKFECQYINLTTASSLENIGKVSLSKFFAFVRLAKNIRKQVKTFMPQLVYITPNAKGGAFYKDFIIVEILKIMGCQVVAHYHNKGVSSRQDRWLDNLLYKNFFKGIKVILLGKSLYKDIEKYVKWEQVYICPNGIPVDENFKKDDVKNENAISILLFLSNLIEGKGVIVLLDALKLLKERGRIFMCNFVGGESAEIDINRFNNEVVIRDLQGETRYLGSKYGKEKEYTYRQADIFVFPTYYDCFPLVLLEAMEYGLPCISTSEGAISDIIDDGVNGFIVERRNAYSLADKIEMLLNDIELRSKMGDEARKKFIEKFTLNLFEKRMCELLDQLLNK